MSGATPQPSVLAQGERRRLRTALLLWAALIGVLLATTARLGPERQSVIRHYRGASQAWMEGRPVYGEGSAHGFLYLPTFAVAHAPFAALPLKPGGLLWRAVNMAMFGLGLWIFARALGREQRGTCFLVLTVVALACSWSSAKHGQATLAMAGALLAAAGMLVERRFTAAAAWLVLAVALKPLAIAMLLVVAPLWPRAGWRMLPLALLAAAAPFLTQAPDYVREQYAGFAHMLRTAGEPAQRERFIDVFSALAALGLDVPARTALLVRLAAGAVTLGAVAWVKRRADERVTALLLYGLVACYLLAFNPRTEHNTYSLIGPALGGFAAWAWLTQRRRAAALFVVLALLPRVDFELAKALTGDTLPWIKPLLLGVAVGAMWLYARRRQWAFAAPTSATTTSPAP